MRQHISKDNLTIEQFNNLLDQGFTLIELLVTVTISALMVGLGIAAYNNFNESQTLELATRNLKTNLWAAQTKAVANKQPTGCTNFQGYQVDFADTSYTIAAYCDGSPVNEETITLPSGVSLSSASTSVLFKPRTAGTNLSGDLELEYTFSTGNKTITITPTGEIKDVED